MKFKNFSEFLFEQEVKDLTTGTIKQEKIVAKDTRDFSEEFEELATKLVPGEGKSDTVEGEILRAASKIRYRWYNDGDKFYAGYGIETAGKPAEYLAHSDIPGMKELIRSMGNKKRYEKFIEKLEELVVNFVKSKNGKYEDNEEDMWNVDYDLRTSRERRGERTGRNAGIIS